MKKQKLFEIGNNRITLFPNEVWTKVGLALSVTFPLCWLAFLIWAGLFQWFNMLYMAVGNTIVMLPFFYAGSRQVIVDGNTQTVQRTSWFGIGKTYNFHDIEGVQMVNETYRGIGGYSFKLTLKKNPYGKSVRLSVAISKTTPYFDRFYNSAVPFIKKLLATSGADTELTKPSRIETAAVGFKFFYEKEGSFVSKPFKTINLVIAIIMAGLGITIMFGLVNDRQFKKEYYALFALAACIANTGIWGELVVINPAAKTIEKSYLGLFRKVYAYQYIIGFSTLRHITGLGNNSIDIIVEIKNATGVQKITLFRKTGSKKVQVLMGELEQILAT